MVTRIYKSMQGKVVDMDALLAKNETMPAVGNAKMNARGDELGPGGKIIRKREDAVAAYYEDNPNATPLQSVKAPVVVPPPPPVVYPSVKANTSTKKAKDDQA